MRSLAIEEKKKKKKMLKLLILVFLILFILSIHFYFTSIWLEDSTCSKVSLVGSECFCGSATIEFLPTLDHCAVAMHDMILSATKKVALTFYLLQGNKKKTHIIVDQIGLALAQNKNVKLQFLIDSPSCTLLANVLGIGGRDLTTVIGTMLHRWETVFGVSPERLLKYVEWYIFYHPSVYNLHTKLVVKDGGTQTLVWTGNIELIESRWDLGLLSDNKNLGVHSQGEIDHIISLSKQKFFRIKSGVTQPEKREQPTLEREPPMVVSELTAIATPVRHQFFMLPTRNSLMSLRIGELFLSAKKSIHICSPQVCDPYWWKCVTDSNADKIQCLTEQRMDDKGASFQKHFSGNRTNTLFYVEKVLPAKDERVEFRTLDFPGLHAKFFIIDTQITVVGSMNVTVFSTRSSSENCVVIKDEAFSERLLREFNLYWDRATMYSNLPT